MAIPLGIHAKYNPKRPLSERDSEFHKGAIVSCPRRGHLWADRLIPVLHTLLVQKPRPQNSYLLLGAGLFVVPVTPPWSAHLLCLDPGFLISPPARDHTGPEYASPGQLYHLALGSPEQGQPNRAAVSPTREALQIWGTQGPHTGSRQVLGQVWVGVTAWGLHSCILEHTHKH